MIECMKLRRTHHCAPVATTNFYLASLSHYLPHIALHIDIDMNGCTKCKVRYWWRQALLNKLLRGNTDLSQMNGIGSIIEFLIARGVAVGYFETADNNFTFFSQTNSRFCAFAHTRNSPCRTDFVCAEFQARHVLSKDGREQSRNTVCWLSLAERG